MSILSRRERSEPTVVWNCGERSEPTVVGSCGERSEPTVVRNRGERSELVWSGGQKIRVFWHFGPPSNRADGR